jgi:DNA-damage-inducible protein J
MTTTLQIRIDKKTKVAAQKAFRSMGLDMTSGVKLYLAQVVNKQELPFHVFSFDNLPLKRKLQIKKEAEWALKYGKSYDTVEELHADILKER